MPTTLTLPSLIESAISKILVRQGTEKWIDRAQTLHQRYFQQQEDSRQVHVSDFVDAQAYLGLRASATYAQITGAIAATCEMLPNWQPQTLLDIGCGPAPALWTASTLLPTVTHATCVDQNSHLLACARRIVEDAQLSIATTWQQEDGLAYLKKATKRHDLVIIANMLNELDSKQRQQVLQLAFEQCVQVLLILEPGTPVGNRIIQRAVEQLANSGNLIAPYLGKQNPASKAFWLHFPQRFTRPTFARKLRQAMRDSPLMASDWEEAKYCYAAISKIPTSKLPWGRCVGPVEMGNGYLEVPILTTDDLQPVKVLKRHKMQFASAKRLRWGQLIQKQEEILYAG